MDRSWDNFAAFFLKVVVCYFVVACWEFVSTPLASHSDSTSGMWVSVLILPVSSYRMWRHDLPVSWFFVYGCGGAFLFLWRFLNIDRFHLWLVYQAPPIPGIVAAWIAFILGMGIVCWGVARVRLDFYELEVEAESKRNPDEQPDVIEERNEK